MAFERSSVQSRLPPPSLRVSRLSRLVKTKRPPAKQLGTGMLRQHPLIHQVFARVAKLERRGAATSIMREFDPHPVLQVMGGLSSTRSRTAFGPSRGAFV